MRRGGNQMTEVSKITLIGHSGWGPVEEAYEERLTVSGHYVPSSLQLK